MLHPKTVEIECADGSTKAFVLHKLAALIGREIVTQYPVTAMPKVGDYASNEAIMLKLLAYVAVVTDNGTPLLLNTRALVDNHVPDFEALMRLEAAMLEYNVSFFGNGKASTFFALIEAKAKAWLSETLTGSSPPSSPKS